MKNRLWQYPRKQPALAGQPEQAPVCAVCGCRLYDDEDITVAATGRRHGRCERGPAPRPAYMPPRGGGD